MENRDGWKRDGDRGNSDIAHRRLLIQSSTECSIDNMG